MEKYTSLSLDERNNTKKVNNIDNPNDKNIDAKIPSQKLIFNNADVQLANITIAKYEKSIVHLSLIKNLNPLVRIANIIADITI